MSLNLQLGPDGDLVVRGGNAVLVDDVSQRVRTRLSMMLGEWFLATADGTPYLQTILVKNPNLELVRSALISRVRETEGVRDVTALVLNADRAGRKLSITLTAIGPNGPFTVSA